MVDLSTLQQVVKRGLNLVKTEPSLIEGLVYASANRRTVGKIFYASAIPNNGLEEPKSDEDVGICVEIWFKQGQKKLIGIGQEPNDLSLAAVKRALAKARRDAVADPDFQGFYKPEKKDKDLASTKSGLSLNMAFSSAQEAEFITKTSWQTIDGAIAGLEPYLNQTHQSPRDAAFILNGDNFIISEKMALATTNGIEDSDESTVVLSFLTAMLEKKNSKGSAWGGRLDFSNDFSAFEIGKKAALAAINGVGGVRIKSDNYNVIFGPQAVTELMGNLLLPNLNLGLVDFGASIFAGKYGQSVASRLLTLYDDATIPGGAGSKKITCEGCPTGKTLLIEKGKLVGFLSDYRTTKKVLNRREESKRVIGVDPHEIRHYLSPRNGFRFNEGGGRVANTPVGIHATNLVVESDKPSTEGELLSKVKNGVYIGRLWYTYPVGGIASGIISGTVIADSYLIRDGKLAEPILPNCLRLEDNIGEMIKRIIGIGNNQVPTILWASDEITHAPWMAMSGVRFLEISK